jgi:hypothetical protein
MLYPKIKKMKRVRNIVQDDNPEFKPLISATGGAVLGGVFGGVGTIIGLIVGLFIGIAIVYVYIRDSK